MKWLPFLLMLLIIIPGLYYTGFITFFKDSPEDLPSDPIKKDMQATATLEEKADWSPIPAPQWEAQNLKGETFSLKELKGQIIILNFWASWCLPCHKEFPELIATTKWGKGDISLVAVSVDSSKEDIKNFLRAFDITGKGNGNFFSSMKSQFKPKISNKVNQHKKKQYIHIIWDPDFKVSNLFHVVKFPETFVLNRDLKIVKKYTGEFSLKEAKTFLGSLLPKKEI